MSSEQIEPGAEDGSVAEVSPPFVEATEEVETGEDAEEAIPDATYEDLLDLYAEEEKPFEYIVGEGKKARKFKARRVTNLNEKMDITEAAERFRELCNKPGSCPETWRPYLRKKVNKKVANMILFCERLLISPRMSQLQLLRLAAQGGDVLLEIAGPLIASAEAEATEGSYNEIVDAKNA